MQRRYFIADPKLNHGTDDCECGEWYPCPTAGDLYRTPEPPMETGLFRYELRLHLISDNVGRSRIAEYRRLVDLLSDYPRLFLCERNAYYANVHAKITGGWTLLDEDEVDARSSSLETHKWVKLPGLRPDQVVVDAISTINEKCKLDIEFELPYDTGRAIMLNGEMFDTVTPDVSFHFPDGYWIVTELTETKEKNISGH